MKLTEEELARAAARIAAGGVPCPPPLADFAPDAAPSVAELVAHRRQRLRPGKG